MSVVMEQSLPYSIISKITGCYDNVISIENSERISGGDWNDVYCLYKQNGDKLVLRIMHPSYKKEGIDFTNRFALYASKIIPEAVSPLCKKDGSSIIDFRERYACLFPFKEGSYSDRTNPAHRDDAARILAELHKAGISYTDKTPRPDRFPLASLDLEQNHYYNWDKTDSMLKKGGRTLLEDPFHQNEKDQFVIQEIITLSSVVYEAKNEFNKLQISLNQRDDLARAPVHGDLYGRNILVVNDKISAVIDWDECAIELLVYELARTAWEYCKDTATFNFDKGMLTRFLTVYKDSRGPVPEEHWRFMVPLLRFLKYLEVMLYLHNSIIGYNWIPSYGLENLKALINLKSFQL